MPTTEGHDRLPSSEERFKTGQVLAGKFRVERVIGTGGMGVVLAATHLRLDQVVALKFLLPEAARNPEVAVRFQREARAAAKIRSEHVARAVDVGTLESGEPYIVMEFLQGADLSTLIETGGPLGVELAVGYLLQACEALAEAHSHGIVHRDLKPGNLFLAEQPDGGDIIKVLDFGISKAIAPDGETATNPSMTRTSDVFGSPTYMSPEQLRASRDVDARTDIWSIGAILFELLSGQAPFSGGTVAEVFGAILYKPTPSLHALRREIPKELEAVVSRCLEKEPLARFANVAELATALQPFAAAGAANSVLRVNRVIEKAGRARSAAGGASQRGGMPNPAASSAAGGPGSHDGAASDPSHPLAGSPTALPNSGGKAALAQSGPGVAQATSTSWGDSAQDPHGRARARGRLIAGVAAIGMAVGMTGVWILHSRQNRDAGLADPAAQGSRSAATELARAADSTVPGAGGSKEPQPLESARAEQPPGPPNGQPLEVGPEVGSAEPSTTSQSKSTSTATPKTAPRPAPPHPSATSSTAVPAPKPSPPTKPSPTATAPVPKASEDDWGSRK